jgi:predicted transcriptional regulator
MEELMAYIPDRCYGEDAPPVCKEVTDAFCSSKQILLIISYPDLRYPGICAEHAEKGLKLSVILTQSTFEKFAEEFKEELDTLLLLGNSEIYVLDNNITPPTLAVTDTMVLTCFSTGQNGISESNGMVIYGEKAVHWGQEIFEHFRALAEPLTTVSSNQAHIPDRKGKDPDDKSFSNRSC